MGYLLSETPIDFEKCSRNVVLEPIQRCHSAIIAISQHFQDGMAMCEDRGFERAITDNTTHMLRAAARQVKLKNSALH